MATSTCGGLGSWVGVLGRGLVLGSGISRLAVLGGLLLIKREYVYKCRRRVAGHLHLQPFGVGSVLGCTVAFVSGSFPPVCVLPPALARWSNAVLEPGSH